MNEQEKYAQLTDLLADRAVQPLSDAEARELEKLLAEFSETNETEFERAAAAIQLTEAMKDEALPPHLKNKIIADANEFFGIENTPKLSAEITAPVATVVQFPTTKMRMNRWHSAGWYVAAACFAFALIASWPQIKNSWNNLFVDVRPTSPEMEESLAALRLEKERLRFMMDAKDTKTMTWMPSTYPNVETVQGDVVWSSEKQQGYMRFKNLAVNDQNQSVYQLWIFDANQDEKYPVDGGIFSVTKSGEVIVPINAKLKITKPILFAVTIEKPGGVVVSKRDKLILTAKV